MDPPFPNKIQHASHGRVEYRTAGSQPKEMDERCGAEWSKSEAGWSRQISALRQVSALKPRGSSLSPSENRNTSGMIPIASTSVETILIRVMTPGSIRAREQYGLQGWKQATIQKLVFGRLDSTRACCGEL